MMQCLQTIFRPAAVALLFTLAACQPSGGLRPDAGASAEERATRLAERGDHAAAARGWEDAATRAPQSRANSLWLNAASAWILAGQADAAQRALDRLLAPLSASDAQQQARVAAEIALARNQPRQALQLLDAAGAPADAAALATRARAQFALGQLTTAISSLTARERLLPAGAPRLDNQRMIVDGLATAARGGADLRTPAGADPLVAGWLELARIQAEATSMSAGAGSRLQAWRLRYPAHPANTALWSELVSRYTVGIEPGSRVALLLPLSGRAAAAGTLVRDGFLTAHYEQPESARPTIRLYDVAASDAATAYLTAIADGADLVIGPLTRDEVIGLSSMADGRVTTLALNFLPEGTPTPSRFYQFALSPEDEARQAARRALADGHAAGVALGPANEWGQRTLNAFAEEFTALGGRLLERRVYAPGTTDFKVIITDLLRIGPSATGARTVRPDVGFIFVAGQPVDGRLIRTQLRFNYASRLPAYSTSDMYEPGGRGNADLDGMILPDMPWVLDPAGAAALLREQADRLWPQDRPSRSRLFAFGYDAYAIGAELARRGRPFATPLPGLSGRLTLDPAGRIQRGLDFAQVRGGRLEPLPGVRGP
jgi:uncharacterized protein